MAAQPGKLFRAPDPGVTFRQRFTRARAHLFYLNCGEYTLPPETESQTFCLPREEAVLVQWEGRSTVTLNGAAYPLEHYDMLYVPCGAAFTLSNNIGEQARVIQCSAPAEKTHPAHHASWQEIVRREERIRRLRGKDVYLVFDVAEPAEKLVAGYTFFQPYQRSWPPHNHTDQEEVYFFLQGHGAMEVYETPETLSFVHSVHKGDAVAIPIQNYHPVFSQEEPLVFLWCIAGARYWVGDKNRDFLKGGPTPITT